MQKPFELVLPDKKPLIMREELDLLLLASSRNPNEEKFRVKAADLAICLDRFDEALKLLAGVKLTNSNQFSVATLQAKALLAKKTNAFNLQALSLLQAAKKIAPNNVALADTLTQLGRTYKRLGEPGKAVMMFNEALDHNPFNFNAFGRWTNIDFNAGREQVVLERCDNFISHRVINTQVLADRYLALVRLGRSTEAEQLQSLDKFLISTNLSCPKGEWESMTAFHAALSNELFHHPAVRYERYGAAGISNWRIDEPYLQRSKVFPFLLKQIRQEIIRQIPQLPIQKHLWLEILPQHARLEAWGIFTEDEGHETWHFHPGGWMSGVYYVATPQSMQNSSDDKGCIEFGYPELNNLPCETSYKRKIIKPLPGQLLLFPSHTFHRTYPTATNQRRLVVAFDVVPKGVLCK